MFIICIIKLNIFFLSGEGGDKKKKLTLGSTVNTKIDAIFILCKNFRFLQFNFKFAKIDQVNIVLIFIF